MSKKLPSLSEKEATILMLLVRHGELFGLELVTRSDGALKRGTVYVTLGRMEDKGYVRSRTEERHPGAIGLPRRLYEPSASGLRALQLWERAAALLDGMEVEAGT